LSHKNAQITGTYAIKAIVDIMTASVLPLPLVSGESQLLSAYAIGLLASTSNTSLSQKKRLDPTLPISY